MPIIVLRVLFSKKKFKLLVLPILKHGGSIHLYLSLYLFFFDLIKPVLSRALYLYLCYYYVVKSSYGLARLAKTKQQPRSMAPYYLISTI